jgi:FAD/FMN-containing dehydrogenase
MNILHSIFKLVLFAFIIFLLIIVVPALFHLGNTYIRDKKIIEQQEDTYVNDASKLNKTKVNQIISIPTDQQEAEQQLQELLREANEKNWKISIAGAQHSMGGHTIYPGGIVINMKPFKQMQLDEKRNILTVQAGALWSDIIPYLDTKGYSIKVMQSNNAFSVGGSLSVNCHGWQTNSSPIASTVESIRIMQADGSIVRASRTEHKELFSLALGGYGLFGIILDADLQVAPNQTYSLKRYIVPADTFVSEYTNKVINNPSAQLAYGRLDITKDNFLKEAILNMYTVENNIKPNPLVSTLKPNRLERTVFQGSVGSDYGKKVRWFSEKHLFSFVASSIVSRNKILNAPVDTVENYQPNSTNILHEYFIPAKYVNTFISDLRTTIPKHKLDLLNITIRYVKKDTDTMLSYANEDMLSFVLFFNQQKTETAEKEMEELTQQLINITKKNKGTYYLPYRLHATKEQFYEIYPEAKQFFELKKKYDPNEIFQNSFYLKYKE